MVSKYPLETTDQTGSKVYLPNPPKRIISLVPSQTELLFDLGLNKEIIGITKFCIHPNEFFRTKSKVGGTKQLNIEKIKSFQPDLIIANKEENEKKLIEKLRSLFPVWTSDIKNLNDALDMILRVGILVDKKFEAQKIHDQVKLNFQNLIPGTFNLIGHSKAFFLYLIWRNPYMAAGRDTFIHDMLARCGFINVCEEKSRYPILAEKEIKILNPSFVFLSSEPYPFSEKHFEELKTIVPSAKIILVNGEFFSWYGSGLIRATDYFKRLIGEINTTL